VLAAVALVVFRDFVLGQSTYLFKDIGSDTLNVFYPSLVLVAKLLRHGLPGWSFAQGMGQDVFPNSVGDPFNDLLYLLGPDRLAYGIALAELLKLLMAGALFYVLLQLRGKTGFTSALGALGFAFCGSIIVGGTWYVFSTNVVQAAFLLVGFELLFQRRNRWLFPLSVAFAVSSSAFNLYVFGILLVVYAVLRWFDGDSAADGQPARWSVPALAGWTVALGIVGVAISAVLVLPSAWELLHSPRGQGETLLPHQLRSYPVLGFGGAHYYASVALRLFGNDLLGPGKDFQGWQNYLEAPMHYSGLLALLLAPQAFAVMRGRARIAWAVVTALGVALHVFPWPRFAFWLFTGDYFRTLSLFVTLLLLALATRALDAIVRKGALRTSLLAGTLIALLVLLFWPWYPAGTPPRIDTDLRAGVALLLVIECCCVLALARPALRLTAQVATLAVVALEVAVLAGISLAGRDTVSTAELHQRSGYNDGTAEAIERIRRVDPGFFRVQKNYSSSPAVLHASINDAKVQGYYSTSSYSSFNQPNYIKFLVEVGIVDPTMELSSRWAEGLRQRPILQTFASVRYWLVKGDWQKVGFLAATYDVADSVPGITVLRNRNFIPLGFATTAVARESEVRALDETHKDVGLLQCAVVPDEAAGRFAALAPWSPDSVPTPYTNNAYASDARRDAEHALKQLDVDGNTVAGHIQVAAPSVLVLTIPFDPGWHAMLDGKPATLERIDFGLTGLLLAPGAHDVRLVHRTPLLAAGAWLSLAGLVAWLVLVAAETLGRSRTAAPLRRDLATREGVG